MNIFTFTKLGRTLLLSAVLAVWGTVWLAGCVGGDKPSELVGHWEYYEGATRGVPEDIELFKDGTGVIDKNVSSTWKVENKRLVFLSALQALSCDYKVSGYELILTYDGGNSTTFVKKGKSEEYKKKSAESPTAKAFAEASNVIRSYESALLAAVAENDFGKFTKDDLIFDFTDVNKNSKLFNYTVSDDLSTFVATAKDDIGDFKKGSTITAKYNNSDFSFIHSSSQEGVVRKSIPGFLR